MCGKRLHVLLLAAGMATLLLVDSTSVHAQVVAPADTAVAEESSSLHRLLARFFGNRKPSGEALDGRAVSAVERFSPDAGDHIEVVLVHPVARFDEQMVGGVLKSRRLVGQLTRPLRSFTDDSVIRDYLLFERGESLDPYRLADSERMLRNLPYISDARLSVVPLNAAGDTVAVVVQTVDRWPLGVDGEVDSADEFAAELFSVNLLGTGLEWRNRMLYRKDGAPDTGYHGRLRKENIAGSFWNTEAEYADSHEEKRLRFSAERGLAHPGITALGGASWDRYRGRRDFEHNGESVTAEAWTGKVKRLYDRRTVGQRPRALLVPAMRILDRHYLSQSTVVADSNLVLRDDRLYLCSLYFQRLKYYTTSFLLGLGETENVPRGFAVKMTGGYQDRDDRKRVCLFVDSQAVFARTRGDVVLASADWGGYFRDQRIEEGMLRLDVGYFPALIGKGRYRARFSGRLDYSLGIRRAPGDRLILRSGHGQHLLPEQEVAGNQRLVSTLESNLFTPWSLAGFRISCMTFGDVGVLAGENADSLWQERFYYGVGVGLNLRNPDLALPTWRITVALRNRVDDGSAEFVFGFRSFGTARLGMPSSKPTLLVYR